MTYKLFAPESKISLKDLKKKLRVTQGSLKSLMAFFFDTEAGNPEIVLPTFFFLFYYLKKILQLY